MPSIKTFFYAGIFIAGLVILSLMSASAARSDEPRTVNTLVVCDLPGIMEAFNGLKADRNPPLPQTCTRFPFAISLTVQGVIAGPAIDIEGDRMFIVRVGEDAYTVAWPGFNIASIPGSDA